MTPAGICPMLLPQAGRGPQEGLLGSTGLRTKTKPPLMFADGAIMARAAGEGGCGKARTARKIHLVGSSSYSCQRLRGKETPPSDAHAPELLRNLLTILLNSTDRSIRSRHYVFKCVVGQCGRVGG